MTVTAQEVASKLLEFYDHESKWTTGWYARTADGRSCGDRYADASCWCALGAIRKIYGHIGDGNPEALALESGLGQDIDDWNDDFDSFEDFRAALQHIANRPT